MTFLLALLLAMAIPAFYAFVLMFGRSIKTRNVVRVLPFIAASNFGAMIVAAGFVFGIWASTAPWRPDQDTNYSPLLFLIGGAVVCGASAIAAFRGNKAPHGAWIVCAMAGLHLAFSGADHLIFSRDKESMGVMASALGAEAGIDCQASYLLVREEGKAFRYRCPTVLQFGNQFGVPFVPWPAYQEGTSEKLHQVLDTLKAQVAKETAERKERGSENAKQ
jgi:hypothetical protein